MSVLTIGIPFYQNHGMLAEQFRIWAGYPEDLKHQIEVVLVDDGSPQPAADVPRPEGLPTFSLFRVLEDRPWHQHGARNLAAWAARGPWLFLTDMDHVLPAQSLQELLAVIAISSPDAVYTFFRRDAPDLVPTLNVRGELKPHVNTFAMTKETFWRIGGYDEDAVGYGTDSYFRKRLFSGASHRHLSKISIVRYPREVIADANTSQPGMDPRAFRNAGRRTAETRQRMVRKQRKGEKPKVLDFPWERVL
jgi:hypothetical protein